VLARLRDLKIGDRFRDRIEESILVFDKLLLVLSTHSVQSNWRSYRGRGGLREGGGRAPQGPAVPDQAGR